MPNAISRSNLLCLVFTDLVDSTQLKFRVGDAAASELMAGHHQAVLAPTAECDGREIECWPQPWRRGREFHRLSTAPVCDPGSMKWGLSPFAKPSRAGRPPDHRWLR